MTGLVVITWGHDKREVVTSIEQLDTLLDRIEAEARRRRRPQLVELAGRDGRGTLGVVVGNDRSLLNHTPADNDPPYLTSRGDEDHDQPFTFYVAGDHHSESHWRNTIAKDAAREATHEFLIKGRLDDRVRWDEV